MNNEGKLQLKKLPVGVFQIQLSLTTFYSLCRQIIMQNVISVVKAGRIIFQESCQGAVLSCNFSFVVQKETLLSHSINDTMRLAEITSVFVKATRCHFCLVQVGVPE